MPEQQSDPASNASTAPTAGDPGAGTDAALGPAGEKALAAEKERRRAATAEVRQWTEVARELGITSPEDLRTRLAATAGTASVDVDEIRRAAAAEATSAATRRIVGAEIRAAAARVLADPADALRFLDVSAIGVDADGTPDTKAITDALDALVTAKPYLAATAQRRFAGSADGGPRNGPADTPQLTRADLRRMTPEQIVEAQAKGQLDDLRKGTAGA